MPNTNLQNMMQFKRETDSAVDLYIYGDIAGVAIYNMLKNYEGGVTTYVDGLAASIASVIAMAGDRIIMRTGSMLMVHKPSFVMFGAYNADDLKEYADTLDEIQRSIMQVYFEKMRPESSLDEINNLVNAETWMTSEEAIKYFDIEEDRLDAVASAKSDFIAKYLTVPPQYAQEEEKNSDEDKLKARLKMQYDFLNLGGNK